MKVNCISCGHNVDIDGNAYDNYEGLVKCLACNTLLEIKTEESSLKWVHLAKIAAPILTESTFSQPAQVTNA